MSKNKSLENPWRLYNILKGMKLYQDGQNTQEELFILLDDYFVNEDTIRHFTQYGLIVSASTRFFRFTFRGLWILHCLDIGALRPEEVFTVAKKTIEL